jgi:AraC family transcriptional regulator
MPRKSTQADKRIADIQRSIDFVEAQIRVNGEKVSVKILAEKANVTERTLQRLFVKNKLGNVWEFVTRLRLEKAKRMMAYRLLGPQDIYEDAGYKNYDSFEDAFLAAYKISPKVYFEKIKRERSECRNSLNVMNVVCLDSFTGIAERDYGDYNGERPEEAWNRLYEIIRAHKLESNSTQYLGVLYDDVDITNKDYCRYDACVCIEGAIPEIKGARQLVLDGGRFIKVIHNGSWEMLEAVYANIFDSWDPGVIFDLANRPILEKYLNDPDVVPSSDLITEILIPII